METDLDELIRMLIAASHDERLASGILYREAAEAVRFLRAERDALQARVEAASRNERRLTADVGELMNRILAEKQTKIQMTALYDKAAGYLRELLLRDNYGYLKPSYKKLRDEIKEFVGDAALSGEGETP